jgi:hypothetical protein
VATGQRERSRLFHRLSWTINDQALITRTIRRALYANAAAASVGIPTLAIVQVSPPPAEQSEAAAPVAEVVVTGSCDVFVS